MGDIERLQAGWASRAELKKKRELAAKVVTGEITFGEYCKALGFSAGADTEVLNDNPSSNFQDELDRRFP